MSDLDQYEDDAIYCVCGGEMEFQDCPECGGDGTIYVGDDLEAFTEYEMCTYCDGEGGWLVCMLVGTAQHITAIEAARTAETQTDARVVNV